MRQTTFLCGPILEMGVGLRLPMSDLHFYILFSCQENYNRFWVMLKVLTIEMKLTESGH